MVRVDPLDDSGPAQSLQPADMGIDIALIVATRNAALELGLLQMAARPIDAVLSDGRNGAVGRSACRVGRADLDDAADPGVLDARRIDAGDMVRPTVDPVHHDGQVLDQLVGEIFVHDATDDRCLGGPVVNLEGERVALKTIRLQRLVHVADDDVALAHLAQGRLYALAQLPNAGRMLGRQPHLLKLGETAQAERPIELPPRIGRLMAQVKEAVISFLGHRPVDARETVMVDLGRQLTGLLDLGDGTKLQRERCV